MEFNVSSGQVGVFPVLLVLTPQTTANVQVSQRCWLPDVFCTSVGKELCMFLLRLDSFWGKTPTPETVLQQGTRMTSSARGNITSVVSQLICSWNPPPSEPQSPLA